MAKGQKKTKLQKKPNVVMRFVGYLGAVRTEMKRIVWPNREEVVNSSLVVITTLLVFIAFVLVVDWLSSTIIIDGLGSLGR